MVRSRRVFLPTRPKTKQVLMRSHILPAAMFAALLACAIGIVAFAHGAYEYSHSKSFSQRGKVDRAP